MYKLRADTLGLKDSHVVYGETKAEVIAKMFQHLQTNWPRFVEPATIERLAELDAQMNLYIEQD
jgi:hypothetical protein